MFRGIIARGVLAGISLSLVAGCAEPVIVIPGGELSGTVVEPPAEWLDVPETIQLETRPGKPYSINIWALGVGRDLYIATSAGGTTWSSFIEADPHVRVRMGKTLYQLRATEIYDLEERGRVGAGYVAKYDVDVEDNWVSSGLVLRLDRR
ncbi:MAG: hypothetical protein QF921_18015 [Pseudomonadales bacterium]|jgi:hypothetical protein|nr:hypothetical protein [Pseudomonadales bacterium]MDP6470438.1 hypothetical protein [Pseudomonadales bacterium]MDP6827738.1 hypothetical protein [Pseudomonadales bacterium]MDP6973382.1 hypothetical protein [Pseudomonadales bacterium]|tara:strand:+ start:1003 stop:1452 length:450 start_codon:yes stop_codon:yes gene_type:complete